MTAADTYKLLKFERSNQGTCNNQRPLVYKGERSRPARCWLTAPTRNGEISLGRNLLVASCLGRLQLRGRRSHQRLVEDDLYTSIHIEEYESRPATPSWDRKKSPATSPTSVKTRCRIWTIAASSASAPRSTGDILVGKVTPKGETELTAEERLLRAIFGEKAREVRDTSCACLTANPAWSMSSVSPAKTTTSCSPASMMVRVYIAQKRKIRTAIRWPAVTATRVLFPAFCRRRICPSCPTAPRWTSC